MRQTAGQTAGKIRNTLNRVFHRPAAFVRRVTRRPVAKIRKWEERPFLFTVGLGLLLYLIIEMLSRRSVIDGAAYLIQHPLLFLYNSLIVIVTLSIALLFRKKEFMYSLISIVWLGLGITKGLVDLMGGVTFDVPVEMHYNDPSQNLYIDLSAGEQKLDGAQAMQVMRFRSGYADADLGRVKVQRDFLAAALHQWASVKNAYKLPSAIRLITEHTKTDLTSAQLAWLAESAALCGTDGLTMATMPGSAARIGGGSYYVLDAAQVADLVNEKLNPYQKEVTAMDLAIRAG